jgi:hypothetical protein
MMKHIHHLDTSNLFNLNLKSKIEPTLCCIRAPFVFMLNILGTVAAQKLSMRRQTYYIAHPKTVYVL